MDGAFLGKAFSRKARVIEMALLGGLLVGSIELRKSEKCLFDLVRRGEDRCCPTNDLNEQELA